MDKKEQAVYRKYAKTKLQLESTGSGQGTIDMAKKLLLMIIYDCDQTTQASVYKRRVTALDTMIKKADALFLVFEVFTNGIWALFPAEWSIYT